MGPTTSKRRTAGHCVHAKKVWMTAPPSHPKKKKTISKSLKERCGANEGQNCKSRGIVTGQQQKQSHGGGKFPEPPPANPGTTVETELSRPPGPPQKGKVLIRTRGGHGRRRVNHAPASAHHSTRAADAEKHHQPFPNANLRRENRPKKKKKKKKKKKNTQETALPRSKPPRQKLRRVNVRSAAGEAGGGHPKRQAAQAPPNEGKPSTTHRGGRGFGQTHRGS